MSLCPEMAFRDSLDDADFWNYVLLGLLPGQEQFDDGPWDDGPPEVAYTPQHPCEVCGAITACGYDERIDGRPTRPPKSCQEAISTFHLPATTRTGLTQKRAFPQVSPEVPKTEKRKMGSEQRKCRCEKGTKWQPDTSNHRAANTGHAPTRVTTLTARACADQPSFHAHFALNQSATCMASTKTTPKASQRGHDSFTLSALSASTPKNATAKRTATPTTPDESERARSLASDTATENARPVCCSLSGRGGRLRVPVGVSPPAKTAAQSCTAITDARDRLAERTYWPEGAPRG